MIGFIDSLVVMVVFASSLRGSRLKYGDVEGSFGDDEIEQARLVPVAPTCVGSGVGAVVVAIAFVRGRPLGRGLLYTHCSP